MPGRMTSAGNSIFGTAATRACCARRSCFWPPSRAGRRGSWCTSNRTKARSRGRRRWQTQSTPIGLADGPPSSGFHALVQASGANALVFKSSAIGFCATAWSLSVMALQPPTSFKAEINHRREAEHDHEELQHLGVNGRGQAAFQNINQHDAGADRTGRSDNSSPASWLSSLASAFMEMPEANTVMTAKAMAFKPMHRFVKPHLQIFRHRARLGAVIKRHHEHGEKDHRRNGADPVKVRGGDAVFGAAGGHADQFQRAEIGGDERQAGHPRRNRARRT